MRAKKFVQKTPWGDNVFEVRDGHLVVKRIGDVWPLRFELTDELRDFLRQI